MRQTRAFDAGVLKTERLQVFQLSQMYQPCVCHLSTPQPEYLQPDQSFDMNQIGVGKVAAPRRKSDWYIDRKLHDAASIERLSPVRSCVVPDSEASNNPILWKHHPVRL